MVQGIGPGRSKRAAALHAAEAIAAQAQGSGDLDGPDNADTAEWLEDDEQDLPATETGRASFDPVNSPVIKGPRTARKKNSEHLAGTGPMHVFEGLLPASYMSGMSCTDDSARIGTTPRRPKERSSAIAADALALVCTQVALRTARC